MKVLQINSVYGVGSTGRITKDIADILEKSGNESYIAYGCGNIQARNIYCMENRLYQKINILRTRVFGKHGFYNKIATLKLIRWIDSINPDIIHLHNIHGHYINIKILFQYLKKIDKPIIWTLHDCWAFTGHCSYFDYVKCEKWKKGCFDCPQQKEYPVSWFFDRSKQSWKEKKELFMNVRNMTIVTPSQWLADLVKQSFLNEYRVKVINNGIDLDTFKPIDSSFRGKNNLKNKNIVLGVASPWGKRKGIEFMSDIAKKLGEQYQLVLVGIDKEQLSLLDKNIMLIEKTDSVQELAELYSAADVFINPTLEDNFPTVNLEALACGTPVITFNTGGSPESLDNTCGIVVEQGDVDGLVKAIKEYSYDMEKELCVTRAKNFDKKIRFLEYLDLYEQERVKK